MFDKVGCRLKPVFTRDEKENKTERTIKIMQNVNILKLQREFCREGDYECYVTREDAKVGFAIDSKDEIPINGLRHPPEGDTSGWYIWVGEEYSSDPDFFEPLHVRHLNQRCPEIVRFLGLPPGYRFLVARDVVDIWFDESLLDV